MAHDLIPLVLDLVKRAVTADRLGQANAPVLLNKALEHLRAAEHQLSPADAAQIGHRVLDVAHDGFLNADATVASLNLQIACHQIAGAHAKSCHLGLALAWVHAYANRRALAGALAADVLDEANGAGLLAPPLALPLARLLLDAGHIEKTELALAAPPEDGPDRVAWYCLRARLAGQKHRHPEALDLLQEAKRLAHQLARPHAFSPTLYDVLRSAVDLHLAAGRAADTRTALFTLKEHLEDERCPLAPKARLELLIQTLAEICHMPADRAIFGPELARHKARRLALEGKHLRAV